MSDIAQRAYLKARLKLRKYAVAASSALRERTAYRGSFLGSAIAYGLFVFVFSRIWASAYSARADIDGYGHAQMVWYFIVAELSSFAFSGSFWSLARDMKSGDVTYLVSRPYSFVLYNYAQGMGRALANCMVLFLEGAVLGLATVGPPPVAGLGQALCVLVSLFLAGSVYFLLNLELAMTAFWVEENAAFYWIFQKLALIVGTLIPIELLPKAAQAVAWWTPLPSMSYVPARLFCVWPGAEGAIGLLAYQAAWTAAAALTCHGVYALGRGKLTVNGG
jgi:ABC-2 type transport system permease protein